MKNRFKKFPGTTLLLPLVAGTVLGQTNSAIAGTSGRLAMIGLSGGELLMLLAAVIILCGIPLIIISVQLCFRHSREKMLQETIRSMVERGAPIPPELFAKRQNDAMSWSCCTPRHDLRNGLLLLGVGIGTVIVGYVCGWIIVFLGLAFVVASMFQKKDKSDGQPPNA